MENAVNNTPAAPVAEAQKPVTQPAVGQMTMMGFLDQTMGTVYGAKEVKNRDGKVVGTAVGFRNRKEIAVSNGLTTKKEDKAALDALINAKSTEAFQAALSELVRLKPGQFRLVAGRNVIDKDGLLNISIRAKEVKKPKGPTDEEIAAHWNMTVEQVVEMRERQEAALKALEDKTITTEAEVK